MSFKQRIEKYVAAWGKGWGKVGLVIVVFFVLLALDSLIALQGIPILLLLVGLALLLTERIRHWLHAHERASLALLPFMTATLVLLFAFTKGRDITQLVLLLITMAVVFDILLIALALISETSKRGLRGAAEFVGLVGMGLVIGLALALGFALQIPHFSGTSLAGP